ncbi:cysteine protease ATG4, putative [Hepatocystis sp. ex Piliocolobus tephrosceles]|nr:cysteine protease ATG4, putative [Hepatocystis sp. ex Piliocolobus tephrosceles]
MDKQAGVLHHNDKEVYKNLNKNQNKNNSDNNINTEQYVLSHVCNINKTHKHSKKNISNVHKINLNDIKNKIDEKFYNSINTSKYKLKTYFSRIKHDFSIKQYFKMLVTVSIFNYLPLNIRNISNDVYICGKYFDLTDSEYFNIFIILCKSKILFTYRSNFLLKIGNSNKLQNTFPSSSSTTNSTNTETKTSNASDKVTINTLYDSSNITTSTPSTSNNITVEPKLGSNTTILDTQLVSNNITIETTSGSTHATINTSTLKNNTNTMYSSICNHINENINKNVCEYENENVYINNFNSNKTVTNINNNNNYFSYSYVSKNHNDLYKLGKVKKKKKCKYYKKKIINFTNISDDILKNIYFDQNGRFYINCDKTNSNFHHKNKQQTLLLHDNNSNNDNIRDSNNSCDHKKNTTTSFVHNKNVINDNNNKKVYIYCKRLSNKLTNKKKKMIFNNMIFEGYHPHYTKKKKKCEFDELTPICAKKETTFAKNIKVRKKKHYIKLKKQYIKLKKKIKLKSNKKPDNTISIYMGDSGWGCMIRVVQMALANIFLKYKLFKEYVFFHNKNDYWLYKDYLNKLYHVEKAKEKEKKKKKSPKKENQNYINAKQNEHISKNEINNNILKQNDKINYIISKSNYFIKKINSTIFYNTDNNQQINDNNCCNPSSSSHNLYYKTKKNSKENNSNSNKPNDRLVCEKQRIHKKCIYTKNYKKFLNNYSDDNDNINNNNLLICSVLKKFRDVENAKYSIQNIIYEAMKHKKIDEENIQQFFNDWLGPTSSAVVISNLINKKKVYFLKKKKKIYNNRNNIVQKNTNYLYKSKHKKHAFFSVAFETGVIYNNRVLKFFQIKQKIFVIIWVCLKLGTDSLNINKYKEAILLCFRLKQFEGISSGNIHTSAHYFYAANDKGLFYLDPHIKCQKAFTELNQNIDTEFFMNKIKFLPWEFLNPSMALIYVVESKDDYFNLIHNLKSIDSTVFEIYTDEPKYIFKKELNFDTDTSGFLLL